MSKPPDESPLWATILGTLLGILILVFISSLMTLAIVAVWRAIR